MKLGDYNLLKVARATSVGVFLEDEFEDSVLLPQKWVPKDIEIGDELVVFLYLDSEERLIATTLKPKIKVNSFAYLRVKQTTEVGAFLDWGMEKDLLVPFIEQEKRMVEGQKYIVYMYEDEMTGRLTGSSRYSSYVEKEEIELEEGQKVNILIAYPSDLGFNVIINDKFLGLLYKNELFKSVRIGDTCEAYIKTLREDNKIDVVLEKPGYAQVEPNSHKILLLLRKHQGFLDLNDKSSPEEIVRRLEMSKKAFKKAIGNLYRQKMISLEEDGIHLL
tara:strand:+ start:24 stop:851 length:828 start_codon:yes stop_codon:yes gene_type:complete